MDKVSISDVAGFEGHAVEYRGDDGYPVGHIIPAVEAVAEDGRRFVLPNDFWTEYDEDGFGPYARTRYDLAKARAIAAAVRDRGYIDATHWVEVEAPVSLEDRFDIEAEREAMERFGYAA